MAFVPQFCLAVSGTAAWVRSGRISPLPYDGVDPEATHRRLMARAGAEDETEAEYEFRRRFRVLDWGPTTDNVAAHAFRRAGRLVITVEFRRGEHVVGHRGGDAGSVFAVEIPAEEFVGILEELAAEIAHPAHDGAG
ncbi:hypothetical protein ABZ901_24285 [Actinacidiphila alni]|uniref:hypothetical protein n=1 Tax=Actinacidiphila alni TaxID=380248 RepID=UPI0033E25E3D